MEIEEVMNIIKHIFKEILLFIIFVYLSVMFYTAFPVFGGFDYNNAFLPTAVFARISVLAYQIKKKNEY